jgi:hypothetical protein
LDAAFTIALLLASQATTANFGFTAENRTGQRPLFVDGEDQLVTELEVTPRAALAVRFKRSTFNISYSPRIYSRINLESDNEIQRPLFLHSFGLGFTQAFTRRVRLNFSANGSVGEVDYSNINLVQGTLQQVPGCDPTDPNSPTCASAAGSLPTNQDTFSTQNYGATLSLGWDVARNHTITVSAGGNYNSSLSDDPIFPENYGGTGSLSWAWRFHPNYGFNLSGSYGESRIDPEASPGGVDPGIGQFRSMTFNLGFDARFSRLFTMGVNGGVLVADNRPAVAEGQVIDSGSSASPVANMTFTFIPTSGRGNYHLTTTFGAGLEGFIDPLAQGYVPRIALSWGLNFYFFSDWGFTPSASLFTPLSEPMQSMTALNETLVSFAAPFSYHINDELDVAIGVRVNGRGNNFREEKVEFRDWFVLGFLSFTAGVATRL